MPSRIETLRNELEELQSDLTKAKLAAKPFNRTFQNIDFALKANLCLKRPFEWDKGSKKKDRNRLFDLRLKAGAARFPYVREVMRLNDAVAKVSFELRALMTVLAPAPVVERQGELPLRSGVQVLKPAMADEWPDF